LPPRISIVAEVNQNDLRREGKLLMEALLN